MENYEYLCRTKLLKICFKVVNVNIQIYAYSCNPESIVISEKAHWWRKTLKQILKNGKIIISVEM